MDIVSCFQPEDIDETRMRHGIAALAQVLGEADKLQAAVPQYLSHDADPMLLDLAGAWPAAGWRCSSATAASSRSSPRTPAARSRWRPTRTSTGAACASRCGCRPDVLRRLGWHYLRVHSFELFADPDAVASRIAKLIGVADVSAETAPITLPNTSGR